MKLKVKLLFVALDNNDEYQKMSKTYLIPSRDFGLAEKAALSALGEEEVVKEETAGVESMVKYKVGSIHYKKDGEGNHITDEKLIFFEVVVEHDEVSVEKTKRIRDKILIQEFSLEAARKEAIALATGSLFEDVKIVMIKESGIDVSFV